MASGGSDGGAAGGKKRKASTVVEAAPAKREPRRGMGVAELERIRVELEMAETCYAVVTSSLSAPAALHHLHPLPAPPPPCFVGHGHVPAGVALSHHQYVGNGAVQVEYFTPYYRAQHYDNDSLTRLIASSGHASRHQKNLVDQIQSAVTTAQPALGQAASSESSSSAYQLQDHRRAQPPQLGQTRKPQVAFVDLVDSDDDDGGAVEDLDLELKL